MMNISQNNFRWYLHKWNKKYSIFFFKNRVCPLLKKILDFFYKFFSGMEVFKNNFGWISKYLNVFCMGKVQNRAKKMVTKKNSKYEDYSISFNCSFWNFIYMIVLQKNFEMAHILLQCKYILVSRIQKKKLPYQNKLLEIMVQIQEQLTFFLNKQILIDKYHYVLTKIHGLGKPTIVLLRTTMTSTSIDGRYCLKAPFWYVRETSNVGSGLRKKNLAAPLG